MTFHRIKDRLIFTIGLFVALLLVTIATATYAYFRHATRQLIFAQQFALISSKAHDLDHELRKAQEALLLVTASAPLEIVANSEAGQNWLDKRVGVHAYFSHGLHLLDKSGTLVASNPAQPEQYGSSLAGEEYFTRSTSQGQPTIVALAAKIAAGQPVVVLTAPIRDPEGEIAGWLCGALSLLEGKGSFGDLRHVRLGSSGYLYLFAPDRTMILHPDPARIMKQDVKPGANKMFDQALAGFEGSGETINSRGLPFLASFKRLESTSWILAANYPTAEAYQPISHFRNYYLLGMFFVLLIVGALAWKLSRAIAASEKRLARGRDYFKALLINNTTGLLAVSAERVIVETNPRLCAMFGYESQELLGQSAALIHLDQEHYEAFGENFRQAIEGTAAMVQLEYQCRRKDGSVFWCLISGIKSQLAARENGVVWSLTDITAIKEAEAKLLDFTTLLERKNTALAEANDKLLAINRELEERRQEAERTQATLEQLSNAVKNSPVAIVITDAHGQIEYVNPKFTQCTGYLPEEVLGQTPRLLNSGTHPKELYQELWRAILAGQEWRGDLCNRKKNGELYWEHSSISPIKDARGKISHFVAIKEDVTEQKRIAAELLLAKDAAHAANLAKSEFLANMSHEIRTPLNAIIGFSALTLEEKLPPRQQGYIQKVNAAGSLLLSLINDILDFSKIEAGQLQMERIPFRLATTLESSLGLLQQPAADKGLRLRLAPPAPAGTCLLGDPHRLGQILVNLLGNAIKFTSQGEVTLTIALRREEENRLQLQFSVRDTGIGLAAAEMERLFQPFTQADSSTTRRFGGTGLGLSISKQLVERMGGEIWCESHAGAGSTFAFTAWFERCPQKDQEQCGATCRRPAGEEKPLFDFSQARILLVEDNEINQLLAIELLKKTGAKVDLAGNGQEAAAMVSAGLARYDLVLMDIQMPIMDGYEATRRIKALPQFATLPIVAMTAHAMTDEQEKISQAGMAAFIAKPIDAQSMLQTMASFLTPPTLSLPPPAIAPPVRTAAPELPKVAGIDLHAALERLGGDEKLYRSLLDFFLRDHGQAATLIQVALEEENPTLAARHAHSLKGIAGNLGATELENRARVLEKAISKQASPAEVAAALAAFASELNRLLAALRQRPPA